MTTTQRPRPPRQAPPTGPNPASRGLILVVAAVLIGAILLIKGGGVGFETDQSDVEIGSGGDDSSTSDTTVTTSTTPGTSVPSSALQVVVLNGAGINGYAAAAATFLNVAGYPNVAAETAAAQVQSTTVYFAPGYEGDAQAIATALSVGTVTPLPAEQLGKAPEDVPPTANVVVVLGPDVEGIINQNANTTTTAAAGSGSGTTGGSTGSTIPASGGQTTTTQG